MPETNSNLKTLIDRGLDRMISKIASIGTDYEKRALEHYRNALERAQGDQESETAARHRVLIEHADRFQAYMEWLLSDVTPQLCEEKNAAAIATELTEIRTRRKQCYIDSAEFLAEYQSVDSIHKFDVMTFMSDLADAIMK